VPEPCGGGKASRPTLRLDPVTTRLLGPVQKAVLSGSSRRAEPDAPEASARRRRGNDMTSPKPEPKPKPANGDDRTPVEEKRRSSGEGGFVFLCALAGHTEVRASPSL